MALGMDPAFLASALTLDALMTGSKSKPETQNMPISVGVNFTMQPQSQSNWCWAATAASTSQFYLPESPWTQCGLANSALSLTDCCDSPVPVPCNVPWTLESTLAITDNYQSMTGTLTAAAIHAEMLAGRPIGARVAWSGGGAHFVVISHYSNFMRTDYVGIADPAYGNSFIRLVVFQMNYQQTGTWTNSYYTKAPA